MTSCNLSYSRKTTTYTMPPWMPNIGMISYNSPKVHYNRKNAHTTSFFLFSNTRVPYLNRTTANPIINLQFTPQTQPTQPTQLKHLSVYESPKTLGVYKLPGGNSSRSCKYIQNKAKAHAAIVARSPLEHNKTWTYYRSILLHSIKYLLPSISLTQFDCLSIEKITNPPYSKNMATTETHQMP